ncbi:MAG: hypothetical protein AB1391_03290 [Candidatus Micrarchaeota archaeon]
MPISIFLNKSEYNAGDELEATIQFDLDNTVKANGIYAKLMCMEKKKTIHTRHIPHSEIEERKNLGLYTEVPFTQTEVITEKMIYNEEKKIAGAGNYQKNEFRIMFAIPRNAVPTSIEFGHDNKINIWKLHVKINIPFALDINATHDIFVAGL